MARAQIFADLLGGALGGLQRDVAGEAFGHDHVDRALAEVVALDEAVIVEVRQVRLAQDAAGLLDGLDALDLLGADIEQPDGRPLEVEDDARHGGAHDRHVDEMARIRPDRGADVEHDALAAQGRPHGGDGRALDMRHGLQAELRPSPSARRCCRRRPRHPPRRRLHRLDRPPHGGLAAPHARSAWLGLSSMRRRRSVWRTSVASLSFGCCASSGLMSALVAEHQKTDAGMALQSQSRARHHNGRPMVAAHRVERNTNWFWHEEAFLSLAGKQRPENSGLRGRRNEILPARFDDAAKAPGRGMERPSSPSLS